MALQLNRKKESRKLGEQMAGTSEKDFPYQKHAECGNWINQLQTTSQKQNETKT